MRSKRQNRRRSSKRIDKQSILIGIGCVLGVVLILGALILTARGESDDVCRKVGFAGADFVGDNCVVKSEYSYDNIVIVAGNTSNSVKPTFTKKIKQILANSIAKNGGTILTILSAAGQTIEISIDEDLDTMGGYVMLSSNESATLQEKISAITNKIATIEKKISEAPSSDGAKYLEAIFEGFRKIKDTGGALIVFGSGLSDRGWLDFANNDGLLIRDPSEIATQLEKTSLLRKITIEYPVPIYWVDIGRSTPPQDANSELYSDNIIDIYKKVLTKYIDGKITFSSESSGSIQSIKTDYKVKTTRISSPTCVFRFDESSSLGFVPGTSDFVNDEESVRSALKEVTECARRNSGENIYIEGYVSRGSCWSDADVNLAQLRADATRIFLKNEMGISNTIIATGKSELIVDECPDGNFNEELAQQNRVVKITIGEKNGN